MQGKNSMDIQYYENLFNPTPLDCTESQTNPEVGGIAGCVNLKEADLCNATVGSRCRGWEQVAIRSTDENGARVIKYQWRHSCDALGNGCIHLMLNADMTLLRDFDDFMDEDGKVSFPVDYVRPVGVPEYCGVPEEETGNIRIYASCFPMRENSISKTTIEAFSVPDESDHTARNAFLDAFGDVFDIMISHVDGGRNALNVLSVTPAEPEGTIRRNQDCPMNDYWCVYEEGGPNPFPCSQCRTGFCAFESGEAKCQFETYIVDQWENGHICEQDECPMPPGTTTNEYSCSKCNSGNCRVGRNGVATCRPAKQ